MAETQIAAITSSDPLSLCVVPITTLLGDVELSKATAFLYSGTMASNGEQGMWLISNWHVFAGRHIDPPNTALERNGAIPNRIKIQVMKILPNNVVELNYQFSDIYNPDGTATWSQHRLKNEVDIGVVNLGENLNTFAVAGLNIKANQNDMKIEIGNDVFILGYPLGFTFFITTPIWKRGIIASEPYLEIPQSRNRIVIDSTTRSGMSGSPVILRQKTHYVSESGEIKQHANASRILGVYSSRPKFNLTSSAVDGLEDTRAELGYVYKAGLIEQIILDGIPGPDYGHLP
jgi:hypothetical protein